MIHSGKARLLQPGLSRKKGVGLFLLLRSEGSPNTGTQGAAHERGAYEYPEVLEGLAAGEDGGADGTGRVDGGTGQVDADQVHQHEGQTDGKTGEVARTDFAVRGSEDDEDEQEGSDDFHEERTARAAGIGDTVRAETAGQIRSGNDLGEKEKDGTGDDGADDLTAPVAAGMPPMV